jgi:hypothetical protein
MLNKPNAAPTEQERDLAGDDQPSANQFGSGTDLGRDRSYDLVQPTVNDWDHQSPEVIEHYYAQAESDFFGIVDDYLDQANLAGERYKSFSVAHSRWRFWITIATGFLALINISASLQLFHPPLGPNISAWTVPAILSAIAAIYASALTVAGNIESLLNNHEKAAGFHESRDLALNRYREYRFKWFYYVEAYGKTGRACINAGRLYRQLVDSDQELRRKWKQLTQVQGRNAGEAGVKVAGGGAN